MQHSYVLYGLTPAGCVAKVICDPQSESEWSLVSTDVYCVLRWLDGDSRLHAHAQVRAASRALERAIARLPPDVPLRRDLQQEQARLLELLESPSLAWCGRIMERVRAGPLSDLERLALAVSGLD